MSKDFHLLYIFLSCFEIKKALHHSINQFEKQQMEMQANDETLIIF